MALRVPIFRRVCRHLQAASWNVPAAAGGTLKVRLPTRCAVRVSPLDPHKSDWDHALVTMDVRGESDADFIEEETAQKVASEFGVRVLSDYEPGRNFVQVEAPPESAPTSFARTLHFVRGWIGGPFRGHRPLFDSRIIFEIQVPGRFDLDVEVNDGLVEVAGTFEGDVKIQSGSADINVNRLKSMYVDIESQDGDVTADVLQGNVSVRAGSGNMDIGRIQGPSVRLVSESGNIEMRALYASYTMIRGRNGDVRLSGCTQGYTKVRTVEGHIDVSGVEGRLDIETDAGDVEAQLTKPQMVSVRSRTGDITVGVPSGLVVGNVLLEGGASVKVDDALPFCRTEGSSGPYDTTIRGRVEPPLHSRDAERKDDDEPVSIYARAPKGDMYLREQQWSDGLMGTAIAGAATTCARAPRKAASGI